MCIKSVFARADCIPNAAYGALTKGDFNNPYRMWIYNSLIK